MAAWLLRNRWMCCALLLSLVTLACAPPGGAPLPSPETTPAPYAVRDLMPSFWTFWDVDRPKVPNDTAALVRLFRERVVQPESAFFARAAGGPSDARIRAFLGRVQADIPAMRGVSARLHGDLPRFTRTFADSFPDFAFDGAVFFYPSLYMRDGGTMGFPPSAALMFGVDVISRKGPDADLSVLFGHELFHLYHAQQHPDRKPPYPLFLRIWAEGLATYVSKRLNPQASELAILLGDERLLEARPRLPMLAARTLDRMDDTSSVYARPYLQGGTEDPEIPPRAGYLIGLRVAEKMGQGRTLRQLARLEPEIVRREMTAALREIAADTATRFPRE
jgi:hypothetical protein